MFNMILSIKGAIPSLKRSKYKVAQNRFPEKTKTNKNMLPSLIQIFTQCYWPVHLLHTISSHSEACPKKQVLPKGLKIYSQNP